MPDTMDVREQALSAMGIAELQVNQSSAPVHPRQSSPLLPAIPLLRCAGLELKTSLLKTLREQTGHWHDGATDG